MALTSTSFPLASTADGSTAGTPLATLHRPSPSVWLLELHNGPDNRLTIALIRTALMPALDFVEKEWRSEKLKDGKGSPGALIISGSLKQDKFFSNGLDYINEGVKSQFHIYTFNPFITRLLLFPLPTIAAINGHAFAAGWLLALACDYRIMVDGSKRRAWACMNEIDFGAPWPRAFAKLFRVKGVNPVVVRKFALEGHRFTPQELLEVQMIDDVAENTDSVVAKAQDLARKVGPKACTGVWGLIKKDLYDDAIEALRQDARVIMPDEMEEVAKARL